MIPYTTKQNLRPLGQELSITAEPHVIGIVGVATVMSNMIKLVEVPSPNFPVIVPGYTITTNPTPPIGQFYVDYVNGYLTFNDSPSLDGTPVTVSYYGRGSEIDAVDMNEVQEPLSVLADIDGTLTPTAIIFSVLTVTNPISITVSEVDNHTGLVIVASSPTTLTIPAPSDTTLGRFFTILNKSTSTQNITINGNVLLIGYGATWLWDGLAWLLISPIPGTTGVPVVASDPSSPFLGQIYFNSTSNQFIGWNGSSWVILG